MSKYKNIGCGYLYFYIHMITEIICFYYLAVIGAKSFIFWLVPLIYDGLAFVPQSIIGIINDKHPKVSMSYIGMILMALGTIIYFYMHVHILISLILIAIGNACVHVNGAEVTLKNSDGKLSHAAIFVAGGSFGVVTGRLLGQNAISPILMLVLIASTIPFIMLANTYENSNKKFNLTKFNYVKENINPILVVFIALFVVIIRGFMGYGIPTSWNKTVIQTIIFYVTMGMGKALGGILSDRFGIRKIAIFSTLAAIPFLCVGNNLMIVSLIGVMLFSMTMAITLGILASVLKRTPGLAFGITTIGLFLGTVPIFFIKTSFELNIVLIIITSVLCASLLAYVLKKEGE